MTDIRQSKNYADYLSRIGWTAERISGANYFIKKFSLIGSILKIQRPNQLNIKTTRQLGKKHGAFQIIIEPDLAAGFGTSVDNLLLAQGFKLSKAPYLPTKTLQLDLVRSAIKIAAGFKKDARLAIRRNLQFTIYNLQTEKQIEKFRKDWRKAVGLKRYVPPTSHLTALKNSFRKNCLFLTTGRHAGAIFLKSGSLAYYWQAFTNKEGRKLQLQYKIVWEGIKWAKKRGAKIFDFEGIYDARFPNKSWLGFTHFKKSFGGKEIIYPGCYTKGIFPKFL